MNILEELEKIKSKLQELKVKRDQELINKETYEVEIEKLQKEYDVIKERINKIDKKDLKEAIPYIIMTILSLAISFGIGYRLDLAELTIQKILTFMVLSGVTFSIPAVGIYIYNEDKKSDNNIKENLIEERRVVSHNLLANRLFLEKTNSKINVYDYEINKLLELIKDLEQPSNVPEKKIEEKTEEKTKIYKKIK